MASVPKFDQVKVGELSFLSKMDSKRDRVERCWMSQVSQNQDELRATLEQTAIENISEALQDIRRSAKVLCPKAVP